MKKIVFPVLIIIAVLGGCAKHPPSPPGEEKDYFETAWVDPQIVISDSLFTLIRASRIDSFPVDTPVVESITIPSVSFEVVRADCPVVVNILDEKSAGVVWPLLVKYLEPGFYRLTLDFSRIDFRTLPPGYYVLKVVNCDIPQMKLFRRE
ncbi:MAG: hypothetical protein JXA92_03750 [candidate division Zixibacteria bacterium]|nr:hypothetical protein [candidate division Zixibacteria bacterium]